MNQALEAIEHKESFQRALLQCPEQLSDKEKLRFLRRVDFDPKAAAERMVGYWERRLSVFGPEYCYLPFTLEGALQRDVVALERGVFQVLGTDVSNRGVLLFDCGPHDWTMYSVHSMVCCNVVMLYFFLTHTQKHGLTYISYNSFVFFGTLWKLARIFQTIRLLFHWWPTKRMPFLETLAVNSRCTRTNRRGGIYPFEPTEDTFAIPTWCFET
mmetsp:Transcript_13722/g.20769  ORF Transcript_13722/g.20769 Transcript_13722/m.20769 type:complete len:213 (+) Transcript_13722:930-1568(+)